MKLRDKRTGEIVDGVNKIGLVWNKYGMPAEIGQYDSLAELNEDWEDYNPTEPLIKDKKIRKAVRAWAEANGVRYVRIVGVRAIRCEPQRIGIEFNADLFVGYVTALKTITELCGEEEE